MPGKDHFLKRIVRVSGEEFKIVMPSIMSKLQTVNLHVGLANIKNLSQEGASSLI